LGSWYEHLFQSICILQHSPISVWFYPCSYICNCFKMPKKSQINEYSDPIFYLQNLSFLLISTAACLSRHSYNRWWHINWCGRHSRICLGRPSNWQPSSETSWLMASFKSEVMLRMSASLVRIVWSAWAWTTLICFTSTGWIPQCPLKSRYPQHLPVGLFTYACFLCPELSFERWQQPAG
jgi:hypothetical protein